MYYGLFVKVGRIFVRIDTSRGFTEDTARKEFKHLIAKLVMEGIPYYLRKLPPVKLIDIKAADRKYLRSDI